jgi:hypothetical protein
VHRIDHRDADDDDDDDLLLVPPRHAASHTHNPAFELDVGVYANDVCDDVYDDDDDDGSSNGNGYSVSDTRLLFGVGGINA